MAAVSSKTTLYADLMSQPSRAVVIFCRVHNLPIDVKLVRLDKGEHRQAWYKEINPLGKVPVLVDGALRLPESPAIVLYLSDRFDLPNHWAPRWPRRAAGGGGASAADSEAAAAARAARFHSALSWQGSSLRGGAMQLLMHRVVGRVFGAPMVPEVAANGLMQLKASLRDLDHYWLDGGRSGFLAGDEISAADLLAACELEQLRLLAGDPAGGPGMEQMLAGFPAVRAWLERVRSACHPNYDEVHAVLQAAVAAMAKRAATASAAAEAKL